MRLTLLGLFAILPVSATSLMNGGWLLRQIPTNDLLLDVVFSDTSNGWISGVEGVFHTSDGGSIWVKQHDGFTWHLDAVSSTECWATGLRDTLLHTTSGGFAWEKMSLNSSLSGISSLGRLCFLSQAIGFVLATRGTFDNWILKTTNGGATWDATEIEFAGEEAHLCAFADTTFGWAAGTGPVLYRTTNGGSSWDSVSIFYTSCIDLQFVDRNTGWISIDGPVLTTEVLKTSDAGNSWQGQLQFQFSDLSTYLSFVNENVGSVVQFTSLAGMEVWRTTNGGVIWEHQFTYVPTAYFRPQRIFFIDSNHGWIVGDDGIAFSTSSGGVSSAALEGEDTMEGYVLEHSFPNPFNSISNIRFFVPRRSLVVIRIYDMLGRLVDELLNESVEPGLRTIRWEAKKRFGEPFASGVYYCTLVAVDQEDRRVVRTTSLVLSK